MAAVVLIGSTGSGKSCFGNYLVDPNNEHTCGNNQTFPTATNNVPETQSVKVCTTNVSTQSGNSLQLTVMDTPGLNESHEKDLEHMIDVIEKLQDINGVLACVLVVKFNSKIDTQYKNTVKYYSELLPTLFQRNVIVVMTEYLTDSRSEAQRQRQRIDVEQIKNNAIAEIKECGNLSYEPLLFLIDCLPFPESSDEVQCSLQMRDAIIDYLTCGVDVFHTATLHVVKTHYLQQVDREEIQRLEGEITGYKERLEQVNASAKEALNAIEAQERKITAQNNAIEALKSEIKEFDSTDTVAVKSWSVSRDWKFLRTLSANFSVTSQWKKHSVKKWTNGNCEWKDYFETENGARGKVEGQFMRGLYASVTLNVMKKVRYKEEIDKLTRKMSEAEDKLSQLQQERRKIESEYSAHTEDICRLLDYIHTKSERMAILSIKSLTLDEAKERLKMLTKQPTNVF